MRTSMLERVSYEQRQVRASSAKRPTIRHTKRVNGPASAWASLAALTERTVSVSRLVA